MVFPIPPSLRFQDFQVYLEDYLISKHPSAFFLGSHRENQNHPSLPLYFCPPTAFQCGAGQSNFRWAEEDAASYFHCYQMQEDTWAEAKSTWETKGTQELNSQPKGTGLGLSELMNSCQEAVPQSQNPQRRAYHFTGATRKALLEVNHIWKCAEQGCMCAILTGDPGWRNLDEGGLWAPDMCICKSKNFLRSGEARGND